MIHQLAAAGVDRTQRPELILLGAVVVAALFIFTRALRKRLVRSERSADSLFSGMASAYVFLVLIPELDVLHEHLGGRGYVLVLGGFVAIYGVEHAAHVVPRLRGSDGEELVLLWMRSAMLWGYGFLFLITMPEVVEADRGLYLFTLAVGALAVAFQSYEVSEHHPRVYQRYGRWAIATGPITGAALDLSAVEASDLFGRRADRVRRRLHHAARLHGWAPRSQQDAIRILHRGAGMYVVAFVARFVVMGS